MKSADRDEGLPDFQRDLDGDEPASGGAPRGSAGAIICTFYVTAGGLMSYGASPPAFHHRSAAFVDRLLRGAHAAEIPIEQPTKFELVINMKTAMALGLTIPPALLLRADHVIE